MAKKVIRITESELVNLVKRTARKMVNENREKQLAIDFYDFVNTLEDCGWKYNDFGDYKSKDGGKYEYFRLEKDRGGVSFNDLKDKLRSIAKYPNGIRFGTVRPQYAPEMIRPVVFIEYIYPEKDSLDLVDHIANSIKNGEYDDMIEKHHSQMDDLSDIARLIAKDFDVYDLNNKYLLNRVKYEIKCRLGEYDKRQLSLDLNESIYRSIRRYLR